MLIFSEFFYSAHANIIMDFLAYTDCRYEQLKNGGDYDCFVVAMREAFVANLTFVKYTKDYTPLYDISVVVWLVLWSLTFTNQLPVLASLCGKLATGRWSKIGRSYVVAVLKSTGLLPRDRTSWDVDSFCRQPDTSDELCSDLEEDDGITVDEFCSALEFDGVNSAAIHRQCFGFRLPIGAKYNVKTSANKDREEKGDGDASGLAGASEDATSSAHLVVSSITDGGGDFAPQRRSLPGQYRLVGGAGDARSRPDVTYAMMTCSNAASWHRHVAQWTCMSGSVQIVNERAWKCRLFSEEDSLYSYVHID